MSTLSEYPVSVQLIQHHHPMNIGYQADWCFYKYWIIITFFSLTNLLSQSIEYLVGNHWVIWNLSELVGLSNLIRYWIPDVGLPIASHYPSDTLVTSIEYCSAHLYDTYTMYHLPDVYWHILNNTMSQYYLCYYRIFRLNTLLKWPWKMMYICDDVG